MPPEERDKHLLTSSSGKRIVLRDRDKSPTVYLEVSLWPRLGWGQDDRALVRLIRFALHRKRVQGERVRLVLYSQSKRVVTCLIGGPEFSSAAVDEIKTLVKQKLESLAPYDPMVSSLTEGTRAQIINDSEWLSFDVRKFRPEPRRAATTLTNKGEDTIISSGESEVEKDYRNLGEAIADLRSQVDEATNPLAMTDLPSVFIRDVVEANLASTRARAELLGNIVIRTSQAQFIRKELDGLVTEARRNGATWTDIGRAAGITSQSAYRRWDPDARRKHSDYRRERREGAAVEPPMELP